MNRILKLLSIIICCGINFAGNAQNDTLFWFAAPEVSAHTENFDFPVYIRISSFDQAAEVVVSQPAGGGVPDLDFTLESNSTTIVDLGAYLDIVETKPANTVLNYGIKISSNAKISAYYEVVSAQCQCNPEIFTLKGQNALGTSFYIPAQDIASNIEDFTPIPRSSFDIVATQDGTMVTIIPTADVVGHAEGDPFTIELNEGQTYSCTAASALAQNHLMGSSVESNFPIAITYKDDGLGGEPFGGTCRDLAGDQLVPISVLGDYYVVVKGFLGGSQDQVYVLATEDNTSISVNGLFVTIKDAGEYYSSTVIGAAMLVETSEPAYVMHLSGFGCEVGMAVLPSVRCTGSSQVTFTRSNNQELWVTLLVPTGGEGDFLFNGAANQIQSTDFADVPGTNGDYKAARVQFSTAQAPIGQPRSIANTTTPFQMGFIHGDVITGCRYGYFSNFADVEISAEQTDDYICENSNLQLLSDTIFNATYSWQGPGGFTAQEQNPTVGPGAPALAGTYIVSAEIAGCSTAVDSIEVAYQQVFFEDSWDICPGESLLLPSGETINAPGIYESILASVTTGCDSVISTTVSLLETDYDLSESTNICLGQSTALVASGADNYSWFTSSQVNISSTESIEVSPTISETYFVDLTFANGCVVQDSVVVEVGPLQFDLVEEPSFCNGTGQIQIVNPSGIAPHSFAVDNTVVPSSTIENLAPGAYQIQVTDAEGCLGMQTGNIINEQFVISAEALVTDQVCESPGTIQITNVQASTTNFTISLDGEAWESNLFEGAYSGIYPVEILDANGCQNEFEVVVLSSNPSFVSVDADVLLGEPPLLVNFETNSAFLSDFQWDFGDGEFGEGSTTAHTFTQLGTYLVSVRGSDASNGCEAEGKIFINVDIPFYFYLPNAFTPDGDGLNDTFVPKGQRLEEATYKLTIINKWGQTVFETNNPLEPWRGEVSFGGYFAQSAVYTWRAEIIPAGTTNELVYKGIVTVVR